MSAISTGATTASGLSFSGLASGIDSSSIIAGLTKLNQQQITQLDTQKTTITTEQTSFSKIQTDLSGLQSAAGALALATSGAFNSFTATASNPSVLSATAGSAAVPGNYTLTVNSLAQSEQVASQGFSDPNTTIQQGTFIVQIGSEPPTPIVVDSTNDTLQGLADAINGENTGVSAAVINDGSGTPYRLLLTSSQTGASNTISVTNNLSGSGASIDATDTVVQAAADAQVTVGSGAGALTVTSPTNQFHSLIPGVSLTALSASPSTPVTLTVAKNTGAAVQAVQSFVTAFNAAHDDISTLTKYDPSGTNTGPLQGNNDAISLQNSLTAALSNTVGGVNASANQLTAAGLGFNSTGDLTFDSSVLTNALTGQTPGVTATDIQNLFALSGSSDNTGVQFLIGSDKTQPTAGVPYQVQITSPATRAALSGTAAPGSSVAVDSTNDTLALAVNGISANVTLAAGTYTPSQLVAQLQQQINAVPALQNDLVSVGLDSGGNVQITSQLYGASSRVAVTGGTAAGVLGFAGSTSATGTDVAGNFVVNGKTEPATGSGQLLSGNVGNANTEGLSLQVTLTSPGTANVTVNQGLASQLNTVLNSYLDPTSGKLANINSSFTQQITNIDTTITQQNTVLSQKTAQLQTQFAQLETSINSLKNIQNQLSSFGIYSYTTGTTSTSSSSSSSSSL
jgi:flagellar hook-associated protein 2